MSKTTKRTGKSLTFTVAKCPKATLITIGFTEQEASLMMSARRVIPFVENRREPIIDARKLWERIGKPEGRFNDWAGRGAAEVLRRFAQKSEAIQVLTPTKGRPRIDYLLSRDAAAHLAMMADTPEGEAIRDYFLLMEDAALRLARYMPIRAGLITEADNALTHATKKQAGDMVKAGVIPRDAFKIISTENDKMIKSLVCKILTGYTAGEWKAKAGRRIRDSLSNAHLDLYARCFDTAVTLFTAGVTDEDDLIRMLSPFANRIDIADYLPETV